MKEEFLKVLESVNPKITQDGISSLTGVIDSLDVMNIVSSLEDAFDVEFEPEDIVPENFESVDAIWKLFQERKG